MAFLFCVSGKDSYIFLRLVRVVALDERTQYDTAQIHTAQRSGFPKVAT